MYKTCSPFYYIGNKCSLPQNDVLLMPPFREGTKHINYDREAHRATLCDDAADAHPASYANASRVTTYLRGGVEQLHGGLKGTYKVANLHAKIH